MTKRFLIILVALLLSSNAYAELNIIHADENQIWAKLPKGTSKSIRYSSKRLDYVKDHCTKLKKNTYTFSYKGFSDVDPGGFGRDQFRFICARSKFEAVQNIKLPIPKYGKYARTFTSKYQKKIEEDNVSPVVAHIEYSHEEFQYTEEEIKQIKIAEKLKKEKDEKRAEEEKLRAEARAEEEKQRAEAIASGDISFTIDDKKEQCEAIGFTPQTDKFADCVLDLVVLDVKSQQQKQIELAISQGNQQVADELRKQRNQQGGQYLMDLGQKLLNPPTKRTTRCTVTGTGSFKTVSCR